MSICYSLHISIRKGKNSNYLHCHLKNLQLAGSHDLPLVPLHSEQHFFVALGASYELQLFHMCM
uniref:Uncharacterized protein n=1 Tax=Arundo donax TaxID=35708 RepID=A0A0A9CJW1_ARUDO